MSTHARAQRIQLLLYLQLLWYNPSTSLKCRSDYGPSEAELKRVTRSCMRKIGDNSYHGHLGFAGMANTNNNNHNGQWQQHQQQNYGAQNSQRTNYYDYDNEDVDNDNDNASNNNNYNNNNNNRRYYLYRIENSAQNGDLLRQRNRERLQMNRSSSGSQRSQGFSAYPGVYSTDHTNGYNGNGNGNGNGNSNNNNGNSNNSNGNTGTNQRTSLNGATSGNGGSGGNTKNNTHADSACVVHCFFEEMNMLNADDYPDKHKVNYMLIKDLRDRDLRNFYTETIQECFRYLESQRKRDKCHFSRGLVNCMTEYAKANCDDWQEFNVMFN